MKSRIIWRAIRALRRPRGGCAPLPCSSRIAASSSAHTEPSSTGIGVENFVTSLPDAVQNAIAEVTGSAGLPPDRLTMEEKIRIVESLHHAGIFYMKGAVSEVAAQLGSSEATIYRYLSKLK